MLKTTFREIRAHRPCKDGWSTLCNNILGTCFPEKPESWKECQLTENQLDTEVSILAILENNGVKGALWSLCTQEYWDYCLILADVAESVLHIWEEEYPDDERPRKIIEAIRLWHSGKITDQELRNAVAAFSATAIGAYIAAANYDAPASSAAYTAYAAGDHTHAAHAAHAYTVADHAAHAHSADAHAAEQWNKNEEILRKYLDLA
jgi:hypothetical protein